MTGAPFRRVLAVAFWIWIFAILALYIGSFGPVIRMLIATLMP